MKRKSIFLLILLFTSTIFSQTFFESLEPGENQIAVYVASCDWGPCIEKVVAHTKITFEPDSPYLKDFEIDRLIYQQGSTMGIAKGELTITEVFVSDSKGNKVNTPSNYVTMLTDVYPDAENSNPFISNSASSIFELYYSYRVQNDSLNINIPNVQGFVCKDVSKFSQKSFEHKMLLQDVEMEVNLKYMFYLPETNSEKKIPLILWFHGLGESGTNPYLVLLGTKSSALAGPKIQSYFENGIAILAPQCPTGWLETTEVGAMGIRYWAPVDIDAPIKKITNPVKKFFNKIFEFEGRKNPEPEEDPFAAVSYYTEPVTALLYDFLEAHPEIDRDRIYVGGCSAGGYMTMNMMIQHSDIFAAAFPTCEYYLDSKITDSQIKELAQKPLWFTYSLNDTTVKPENCCIPTIKRLKIAGAKNLKISEFPNVIDLTGKYYKNRKAKKDDDDFEKPFEYDGHYSWIYVLDDLCYDENESLFEWLSHQSK